MLGLTEISSQLRRLEQGGVGEFAANDDMGARNILRMQPRIHRRSKSIR